MKRFLTIRVFVLTVFSAVFFSGFLVPISPVTAEDFDDHTAEYLDSFAYLPLADYVGILGEDEEDVREWFRAFYGPETTESDLVAFARDERLTVRMYVLGHRLASDAVFEILARDSHPVIRINVAYELRWQEMPTVRRILLEDEELLIRFLASGRARVEMAVAESPVYTMTDTEMVAVANGDDIVAKWHVVNRPDTPSEVFDILAKSDSILEQFLVVNSPDILSESCALLKQERWVVATSSSAWCAH